MHNGTVSRALASCRPARQAGFWHSNGAYHSSPPILVTATTRDRSIMELRQGPFNQTRLDNNTVRRKDVLIKQKQKGICRRAGDGYGDFKANKIPGSSAETTTRHWLRHGDDMRRLAKAAPWSDFFPLLEARSHCRIAEDGNQGHLSQFQFQSAHPTDPLLQSVACRGDLAKTWYAGLGLTLTGTSFENDAAYEQELEEYSVQIEALQAALENMIDEMQFALLLMLLKGLIWFRVSYLLRISWGMDEQEPLERAEGTTNEVNWLQDLLELFIKISKYNAKRFLIMAGYAVIFVNFWPTLLDYITCIDALSHYQQNVAEKKASLAQNARLKAADAQDVEDGTETADLMMT